MSTKDSIWTEILHSFQGNWGIAESMRRNRARGESARDTLETQTVAAQIRAFADAPQASLAGNGDTSPGSSEPQHPRDAKELLSRFTDRARECLRQAHSLALWYGHVEVTPGHLLAGIAGVSSGVGGTVLRCSGFTWHALCTYIGETMGSVQRSRPSEPWLGHQSALGDLATRLPQSAALQRVLAFAWSEARALGDNHVGTEHLLVSALRDTNAYAATLCDLCCVSAHLVIENTLSLCAGDAVVPGCPVVDQNERCSYPIQSVLLAVDAMRQEVADVPGTDGPLSQIVDGVQQFRKALAAVADTSPDEAAALPLNTLVEFGTLVDAVGYVRTKMEAVNYRGKRIDPCDLHLWSQVLLGQYAALRRAIARESPPAPSEPPAKTVFPAAFG